MSQHRYLQTTNNQTMSQMLSNGSMYEFGYIEACDNEYGAVQKRKKKD